MVNHDVQTATLGGGCFWCLEAVYQEIEGVERVVSGYAGGTVEDPSYEAVCSGKTGHAEVVQVYFDPDVLSYADILEVFWAIHNPTTPDRQGHDFGSQYRSIILTGDDAQQDAAEHSRDSIAKLWPDPVVTEILSLVIFYEAESHHQNYFRSNPERAYCQAVINPKLVHLRAAFAGRLKKS